MATTLHLAIDQARHNFFKESRLTKIYLKWKRFGGLIWGLNNFQIPLLQWQPPLASAYVACTNWIMENTIFHVRHNYIIFIVWNSF